MMDRAAIVGAIQAAMEEYNAQQADDERIVVSAEAELFGSKTALTSMGLVNLVVLVEEQLMDQFGADVTLANDRAFAEEQSPFRSVQALASYIEVLIGEQASG